MRKIEMTIPVTLYRCEFCGRTYADLVTLKKHGCENENPPQKYSLGQSVFVMRTQRCTQRRLKQVGVVSAIITPAECNRIDIQRTPETSLHFYGTPRGLRISAAVRMDLSGSMMHEWKYVITIEEDVLSYGAEELTFGESSLRPNDE